MALMVSRLSVSAPVTTYTVRGGSGSVRVPHSSYGSLSRICRAIFRRLPIMVCVTFCTFHPHAFTHAISSGAVESTIQSILNSCGSVNTATLRPERIYSNRCFQFTEPRTNRLDNESNYVNCKIGYNDPNNSHRISYETQATRRLRRYRSPK